MAMKFDSNRAWKEASSAVAANREVLLALAGVFFLLPSLAFSLFFPQPQTAAGMSEQQIFELTRNYYSSAMPFMIPVALIQAAGTLALLTLFTDRSRPTVGEAIRLGLAGLLSYFAAQLLLGIGLGLAGGLLLALGAVTGSKLVIGLVVVVIVVAAAHVAIRTSLVAPIVAVERERNPITALKRSWRLTRGNAGRIFLFLLLVVLAFVVVVSIVMAIVGIVLALVAGAELARVVAAVVSSALGAVMTLYLVAILAAVHRQLAGPSPQAVSAPFE
jgi:hypothetical protein